MLGSYIEPDGEKQGGTKVKRQNRELETVRKSSKKGILLKLRATPVLTCTCSSVYLPITVFGLSWHSRKRRVQTSKMVMEFTGITQ